MQIKSLYAIHSDHFQYGLLYKATIPYILYRESSNLRLRYRYFILKQLTVDCGYIYIPNTSECSATASEAGGGCVPPAAEISTERKNSQISLHSQLYLNNSLHCALRYYSKNRDIRWL